MKKLDQAGTWLLISKQDKLLIKKLLIRHGKINPSDDDIKQFVFNAVELTDVDYYRLIELVKKFVNS
jgi:hypothetical protein